MTTVHELYILQKRVCVPFKRFHDVSGSVVARHARTGISQSAAIVDATVVEKPLEVVVDASVQQEEERIGRSASERTNMAADGNMDDRMAPLETIVEWNAQLRITTCRSYELHLD